MAFPGGKNGDGIWQRIICQIPPHRVYCEPFLGSGAVMRRKRPAKLSIGIDLDPVPSPDSAITPGWNSTASNCFAAAQKTSLCVPGERSCY